jgi:hypothetical protein
MGQYYKIVNPVKKQFLDAGSFGENIKASGVLYGYHAVAVALLVCNLDQVSTESGKPRHDYGILAGSWCGDSIYAAGDEDYSKPDQFGIKTSTEQNPHRNLNQMAKEEFEDISYKAIAMLSVGREEFSEEITKRIRDKGDPLLLMHLGNVVFMVGCESLKRALIEEFGEEWTKLYKQARDEYPSFSPKLYNELRRRH